MIKTAVILAAGMGNRLKQYSLHKPKAFIRIGKETLVERSINILAQNGVEEIIIGTGFRSEYFALLGNKCHEAKVKRLRIPDYADTGSMFTLYSLRSEITGPFLLLESDLLYEELAIKAIQDDARENVILASSFTNAGDEVFIETNDQNQLINLSKEQSELTRISAEFVGISKLSWATYQSFCHLFEKNEAELKKDHYETAFPRLALEQPFSVLKMDELVWCEIDYREHLIRAEELIFPEISRREAGIENYKEKEMVAGEGFEPPTSGL